jgi:hypothetical protein
VREWNKRGKISKDPTDLEHSDCVTNGRALYWPKKVRSKVEGPLRVIERIEFVGAAATGKEVCGGLAHLGVPRTAGVLRV